MAGLTVLDANILIAYFETENALHSKAFLLLANLISSSQDFGASPITIAEILVGPTRVGSVGRGLANLTNLSVRTIALSENSPMHLARLRVDTGLKIPDCCVLLAAEQEHADIATFDLKLAAIAAARGISVRSDA